MSDIRKAIMARLGEFARDAGKTTADLIREAQKLRDQMKTDATEANKQRMRQIKSELDSRGVLMPYGADQMMSRPGSKARFGGDWHGKRVTSNAGKMFLVQRSATGYDLYSVDSGKKAKSMTQEQMDEAQRAGKFRDVFSSHGAKAAMAVHAGALAMAQANYNRAKRELDEAQERLDAFLRVGQSEQRIAQAERGVEIAEQRFKDAEKALRSLNSRPGTKAAFAITKEQIRGASREELRSIEQRLMALAKSGDKNAAALLDHVEEEYNERYRGTHSRPGAKSTNALSEACWQGYEAVGTKKQDGKTVPNCVPKATMGRAEQVMRDGSVHLDFKAAEEWLSGVTESALRYIIDDASKAAKAMPDGNKFNYYHDLSLTAQDELRKRQSKKSKATAAKPESQDIESEEVKAGLKLMEKADEKVSEKIRTLIKEGKPQDQAVAIALDMKRRGEL